MHMINFLSLARNGRERETEKKKKMTFAVETLKETSRFMCVEAAYYFLFCIYMYMLKCYQQMYYSARQLFFFLAKSYHSTCFVNI
jgi:hypothetical protein